jgi:hypothetical protein
MLHGPAGAFGGSDTKLTKNGERKMNWKNLLNVVALLEAAALGALADHYLYVGHGLHPLIVGLGLALLSLIVLALANEEAWVTE